jgi:hypothetical protein
MAAALLWARRNRQAIKKGSVRCPFFRCGPDREIETSINTDRGRNGAESGEMNLAK